MKCFGDFGEYFDEDPSMGTKMTMPGHDVNYSYKTLSDGTAEIYSSWRAYGRQAPKVSKYNPPIKVPASLVSKYLVGKIPNSELYKVEMAAVFQKSGSANIKNLSDVIKDKVSPASSLVLPSSQPVQATQVESKKSIAAPVGIAVAGITAVYLFLKD
jgi:hypothetical protein